VIGTGFPVFVEIQSHFHGAAPLINRVDQLECLKQRDNCFNCLILHYKYVSPFCPYNVFILSHVRVSRRGFG
jgi:hypothetical protein